MATLAGGPSRTYDFSADDADMTAVTGRYRRPPHDLVPGLGAARHQAAAPDAGHPAPVQVPGGARGTALLDKLSIC